MTIRLINLLHYWRILYQNLLPLKKIIGLKYKIKNTNNFTINGDIYVEQSKILIFLSTSNYPYNWTSCVYNGSRDGIMKY